MIELRLSGQFRKDFKRYKHIPEKVEALNLIMEKLRKGEPIPVENKPHKLSGQYRKCMECHVGSDFLLIWKDEVNNVIYLVRLGSHSELFE